MIFRAGVCSFAGLCALVFAAAGQATITPGKATLGSSSQSQALTPPVRAGDRHATAATWHDGALVSAGTINCVTGFVESLGGSYVGWFGDGVSSPVVNQTYYIRVGWGIAGNPCTGGAYVHTEIQLPSFTSLAVTATNKVRCFYQSPSANHFSESPSGCPQAPTSVGLYGGLSFDPVGATAWPSAFGSLFEIWIPVKTTQPLSGVILGGSSGCPSCLFAGTWMIDGWNSPWVFPVQGVYVKQGATPPPAPTPYIDYPTPNNYSWPNVSFDWATAGYVFNTTATSGAMYVDIRAGTSGAFSRATTPWNTAGSWKIEQPWSGLTPGGTYQFRVCYDPDQGGSSPEVCGVIQTFKRPGGVDGTAPNTSIKSKPPARTNQKSATFTFSSNELGSTFWCKLDGGAYAECTAPTYTNLGAGSHTLLVYAEDQAHNLDPSPAGYSWTIDLTKPNTTIKSGPKATTSSTTAKFKFSSNEAGSTFKCKLDAKPWAACGASKTFSNLKKGRHTLKVKAVDKAGNEDPSPASKGWRVT